MGIPDHLTWLLRNLYPGQEATENWTWNNRLVPNWERSMSRLYIVTCLFNLNAEFFGFFFLVKSLSHARLFATPWTVACTKLLCPWDFQDKSTGVGCHFLLQLICRVHHVKFLTGWRASWNQYAGRNINNLRYADDTTFMGESKEDLKSILMKVKEKSEKIGLKQHLKNEDHGIWSHHFMENRWGDTGNSESLYFLGLQNHCRWWMQPWS